MTESHYRLGPNEQPALIKQHSLAKHEVLRTYLYEYFKTLTSSPGQEIFKLSLVDGFAGYGKFVNSITGANLPGSPLIMLKSANDAASVINQKRTKPILLDVDFIFVEKHKKPYQFLRSQIADSIYAPMLESTIKIVHSPFEQVAPKIIQSIAKKTPRTGRSIFLLDQYGYTDVDTKLIRNILTNLPKSEVILTFNVDSLLNYAAKDKPMNLAKISLPDPLKGRFLGEIKANEADWRLLVQCSLYKDLVDACGAKFYTLFYIRSPGGHGCYWLLHLSQHPIARDVMTRTHWANHNYFIHYGGPGLDMLNTLNAIGFDPSKQNRLPFGFDLVAEEESFQALRLQLLKLVYEQPEAINFGKLYESTCNFTPATAALYKKALANLIEDKYLIVTGLNGSRRRSAQQIKDDDLIERPRQPRFFFP